jgi:hypothetical protein
MTRTSPNQLGRNLPIRVGTSLNLSDLQGKSNWVREFPATSIILESDA